MTLAQAIEERETARSLAITWMQTVQAARKACDEATRALDHALKEHGRAKRRFATAVTVLHPLLDADVAGIAGPVLDTAAVPHAKAAAQ